MPQPLEVSYQELLAQIQKRHPLEYENAVLTVTNEKLAKRNVELENRLAELSPDQED